jgi:predicted RND superfamily exporter protein
MRIGGQPIALAAVVLVILVFGAGSISLWRAYTGSSPEQDFRTSAVRQMQTRAVQASEQLIEKTKALDVSQQEAIDQLQALQDQMETVKRLLAAQQNDNKRLSDQVGNLTGAVDNLRQSFASTQSSEPSSPPSARHAPGRSKSHAARTTQTRRVKPKT